MVDGKRAAFALVHREQRTEMAEFYSFPEFRRTGVALDFARQIIKRFPGPWEISQYRAHVAAVAFWHRVIEHYPFSERVYIGGQGKERLEQTFVVP
jgi:predicted acetyltransferase